jgi:hypothetical protein
MTNLPRKLRPPPLTADEITLFKQELKTMRTAAKHLRSERHKYLFKRKLPPLPVVEQWMTLHVMACDHLRHWDKVLMPDRRNIRSPVRLWDALNEVLAIADVNDFELHYYLERHGVIREQKDDLWERGQPRNAPSIWPWSKPKELTQ